MPFVWLDSIINYLKGSGITLLTIPLCKPLCYGQPSPEANGTREQITLHHALVKKTVILHEKIRNTGFGLLHAVDKSMNKYDFHIYKTQSTFNALKVTY